MNVLHQLLIAPLELLIDAVYTVGLILTRSPGFSLFFLSLAVNLLLLPLYLRADALQEEERCRTLRLKPGVDHIRKVFRGDEKFMILQAYYRQNHYKPYYALKSALSLLLQVPFFIAAYHYLSASAILQGAVFGPIADLGAPDGLLSLGGISINLLPVLMTCLNLLSGAVYTRGLPWKNKLQVGGIALVFLVLLYRSPAGLVLYWTLNNLFSLVKNMLSKKLPARSVSPAVPVSAARRGLFALSALLLALLSGLLIPSAVIKASPGEFISASAFRSPLRYLLPSFLLASGAFGFWGGVYERLASPRGRKAWSLAGPLLAAAALVCFMFFGRDYGIMTSLLRYENPLQPSLPAILLNLAALLGAAAALFLLWKKKPALLRILLLSGCLALLGMSVVNITEIQRKTADLEKNVAAAAPAQEIAFPLDRQAPNVVVIMLDRCVDGYVPFALNEVPGLKEQFDGFTWYPNTLSYGYHTNIASPALFGGYEYTPEALRQRLSEYLPQKHNESLKVMPAVFGAAGMDVTVCDAPFANYAWIPDLSIYEDNPAVQSFLTMGNLNENPEEVRQKEDHVRSRNLFCYALFRSAPVALHSALYQGGAYLEAEAFWLGDASSVASGFLDSYMVLKRLPEISRVRDDGTGTFLMLANKITHEAIELREPAFEPAAVVDNTAYEAAHRVRTGLNGETMSLENQHALAPANYQSTVAAFRCLGAWFDFLRESGVYDNTRIILVSDHGCYLDLLKERLSDKYPSLLSMPYDPLLWEDITCFNPLLLVKDFNAHGFTTDPSFMTNADTPSLAFAGIVDHPVNPFTGRPITTEAKHGPQLLVESAWDIDTNNGSFFSNPVYLRLNNENIFSLDNWEVDLR